MTDEKINFKEVNDVTNAGAQAATAAGVTATSTALNNDPSPSASDQSRALADMEVRVGKLEDRFQRLVSENFRTREY